MRRLIARLRAWLWPKPCRPMLTPFPVSDEDVPFWRMAVGCKVIVGPEINVVVAMGGR